MFAEFLMAQADLQNVGIMVGVVTLLILIGAVVIVLRCYKKVEQGTAIIRNGMGGTKVSFSGQVVIPVVHRFELMDISVKRIEIDRSGPDGLICKDNIRADIKVVFFVRVNKTPGDVEKVAQFLGCRRASDERALVALFEPKILRGPENRRKTV